MLIYSSIQLYYNLYLLLQPIFSLFFVFLALPTEVKPLCKSQFVTVQRIDVDVVDVDVDVPVQILGISLNITNQVVHIKIMLLPDISFDFSS